MKPIILDINKMSESVELYEARPKKAICYTIYAIFALVIITLIWAYFFKIEITVKSDGLIKNDNELTSISCGVTGKIDKCNVRDGQLVQKGDILFTLDVTSQENEKENENQIKDINSKDKNYTIIADNTGYVSLYEEILKGKYITQGSCIGQISPKKVERYIAQIMVDNKDIGKIEEGQKIRYEIPSFPTKDFGEFTGEVKEISNDIRIDEKTGKAYYLVSASFDKNTVSDKEGKEINLMNKMQCQANVVTKDETVLEYLLRELSFIE